jgi:hypothetical protein
MTIRDHINGKLIPVFCVICICLVIFALLAMSEVAQETLEWVVLLPFLGIVACILYLNYVIRCPRCGGKIAGLTHLPRGGFFRLSQNLRFCPFCGVELDREIETLVREERDE